MILEQAYKDGIEHGTPKPQYGYTLESYLLYIQTCGFYEVYNLTDSGFDYTPIADDQSDWGYHVFNMDFKKLMQDCTPVTVTPEKAAKIKAEALSDYYKGWYKSPERDLSSGTIYEVGDGYCWIRFTDGVGNKISFDDIVVL